MLQKESLRIRAIPVIAKDSLVTLAHLAPVPPPPSNLVRLAGTLLVRPAGAPC